MLIYVYLHRVSNSVVAKSSVTDMVALDGQQPIPQENHIYSTVDDTQGENFMVASNSAYGPVAEHSRQPVPQDDDIHL